MTASQKQNLNELSSWQLFLCPSMIRATFNSWIMAANTNASSTTNPNSTQRILVCLITFQRQHSNINFSTAYWSPHIHRISSITISSPSRLQRTSNFPAKPVPLSKSHGIPPSTPNNPQWLLVKLHSFRSTSWWHYCSRSHRLSSSFEAWSRI